MGLLYGDHIQRPKVAALADYIQVAGAERQIRLLIRAGRVAEALAIRCDQALAVGDWPAAYQPGHTALALLTQLRTLLPISLWPRFETTIDFPLDQSLLQSNLPLPLVNPLPKQLLLERQLLATTWRQEVTAVMRELTEQQIRLVMQETDWLIDQLNCSLQSCDPAEWKHIWSNARDQARRLAAHPDEIRSTRFHRWAHFRQVNNLSYGEQRRFIRSVLNGDDLPTALATSLRYDFTRALWNGGRY